MDSSDEMYNLKHLLEKKETLLRLNSPEGTSQYMHSKPKFVSFK